MACTVHIPSPLRAYTAGAANVRAEGGTIEEVLASLERQFAGIRFRMMDEQSRIRPHIRLYLDAQEATVLSQKVDAGAALHVICALSGG